MSWPNPGDPFYLANQTDNDARRSYYGVNATPTQKCDGTTIPDPTYQGNIDAALNARLAVPSHLWMSLSGQVLGDTLIMNCTAVADRDIVGSTVIQFALLDHYSYLPQSPNGQPNHYHAMHDMAPSASGQSFWTLANDTVHYSASFYLNPAWSLDNLDMSCFVQDNSTREVLQSICAGVPLDFPNILVEDYEVSDPLGNGDGRVDPGESGNLVATLLNQFPFHDAVQVVATLQTDDPLIQISTPTVNFPDLLSGASASNADDPFIFSADPALTPHEVTFTITITAQPGPFQATYPLTFMVGRPDVLLVNDDVAGSFQSFYETPLDSLGIVHDVWNQFLSPPITLDELERYPYVIWYTGNDAATVLNAEEQQQIENFLYGGGRLMLSSQNAGDVLGSTAFYGTVLHAQHLSNSVGNDFPIEGVDGDPISGGTSLLPVGSGGASNANSCASLLPIPPAVGIYTYHNSGTTGALRFENEIYKLIYLAFPFEAVSGIGESISRTELMDLCLAWLESPLGMPSDPDHEGLPTSLTLRSLHPNPFNPSVQIAISLPQSQRALLSVFNLEGKLVDQRQMGMLIAGDHLINWNSGDLPSGIYLLKITSAQQSISAKAVLLK